MVSEFGCYYCYLAFPVSVVKIEVIEGEGAVVVVESMDSIERYALDLHSLSGMSS